MLSLRLHNLPLLLIAAAAVSACGTSPIPCTEATSCEHLALSAPPDSGPLLASGSVTSTATGSAVDGGTAGTIPVFRNLPLLQGSAAVTTAVVAVHALQRGAHATYETLLSAAQSAGVSNSTLIVAPLFPLPPGDPCDGATDVPSASDLVWSCTGYKDGAQAIGGPGPLLDSYAVMDQLLAVITNPTLYPNLKRVVITGHAAGGQFALRYSAVTQAPAAASAQFVVVNPGSYLYLDDARPGPELSCSSNGGCNGALSNPYSDAAECPAYDSYPWGLENSFGAAALSTPATIRSTLLSRNLSLLVGDEDTLANSAGTDLDTGCEANAQGLDRLSRAINFWNYLQTEEQTTVPLFVIPNCKDDRDCLYQSSAGLAQVFGT